MNSQIKVGILINRKKEKFISKFKRIKDINFSVEENIKNISDYDVLVIDYKNFIKYKKKIIFSDKSNFFKIFLILSKKNAIKYINRHIDNFYIYTFLPYDIPYKKLVIIFKKYINDYKNFNLTNDFINKCERQNSIFETLTKIGISLSVIRDIEVLLDLILTKAREITNSDAGSIFLNTEEEVKDENGNTIKEKRLKFVHSQNFSFPIKSPTFSIPLTKSSIVGYTAITGITLNIPDAHKIPPTADYSYSVETEKKMGVHNRSILTIPMKNHRGDIIGVLQLFNKKRNLNANIHNLEDFEREVIPYDKMDETIVSSLASQAAVSLENSLLYKEIKNIFEGFIKASVTAIESRDPTTSGHSERVARLTVELAKKVDRVDEGPYKDVKFSDQDIKNLEYAGLLHDFGKIGVREKVLVKANKLYPEELELLKLRYEYLKKSMLHDTASKKIQIIKEIGIEEFLKIEKNFDEEIQKKLNEIEVFLDIILKANQTTVLEDDRSKILKDLVGKEYITTSGEIIRYLTDNEIKSLSVLKGSLTEEERREIESHVTHTFNFLCKIPWTKEMADIPYIAYMHHEKLDGHGYPRGITAKDIPIQARMMTISDIFDALTARDRPYKKAVSIEKALDILIMERDAGKIDSELLKIFIEAKIYKIL
ncbi:MAG TPA: HD domain-containing phosphohydrolase [Spirochaetota bacterium]|nr:HD domain-containing phosphohydrolase [Spirochaetota bacterium]HOL56851.1 HD domain-containing phosphohydrolase [Spirochaetota bacterium]HPP04412.1 HD domain-containing phosphohydrolase [Spirochaetota bacterium]